MNIDSRLIKIDSLLRQVVSLTWTSLPEERRSGRRTPERSAPHACAVHRQLLRRSARVRSVASARGGARPQSVRAPARPLCQCRQAVELSWLRSSPGPRTASGPGSSGFSWSNPELRTPPPEANPPAGPESGPVEVNLLYELAETLSAKECKHGCTAGGRSPSDDGSVAD